MLTIDHIRRRLRSHSPRQLNSLERRHAAVAMLLTEEEQGPEALFIRRAEYEGDPWSGDVAFPGGGVEPQDEGAQQAAERETYEEIGLRLQEEQCLGQLDDLTGAYLPVRISCFVYLLPGKPHFILNEEVVDTFWVPLATLSDPERGRERNFSYRNLSRTHPIIDLNGYCDHFLWGITYRLLQNFFSLSGWSARQQEYQRTHPAAENTPAR